MLDSDGLAASRHNLLTFFVALHAGQTFFLVAAALIDADPVDQKRSWCYI
jgi:hypothetical protein